MGRLGPDRRLVLLLALMSLAIFVATALPFHSRKGGFMSDGARCWNCAAAAPPWRSAST